MLETSVNEDQTKNKEGIAGLAKKLATVMGEVERIPKSGWNAFNKYKYVTDADMMDSIRPLLAEQGICLIPSVIGFEQEGNKTRLDILFSIIDSESGATMTVPWSSEANDKGDKGVSKAMTLGLKYFLKSLFLVSTGDLKDDPDSGIEATDTSISTNTDTKTKRVKGMKADDRPAPTNPLDDLRKNVHTELGELDDAEIAQLAGIKKFNDLDEWRKKYSVLADAFEVIKKAYLKPATAKGDGDAETPPFEKTTSKST